MRLFTRRFAAALLALAWLFAGPAAAREAAAREAAAIPAHPALWKVADADTTIYLFGTIHLLPPGIDWYNGALADALAHSGELVTEIPEIAPEAQQTAVLARAILPGRRRLRALLSPRERARYDAALRRLGLPVAAFDRYKPWYAAIALATVPLERRGFARANGIEDGLAARAAARGIPRKGLETLDSQLALFDGFSPAVQKRYLIEVIRQLPALNADADAMVAAWRRGDAARLAALLNAGEDDPAMIAALLTRRNQAWARWIGQRLARPGAVFVAVGAGHLGGPGSVQDQLAKAGIAVSRVQ